MGQVQARSDHKKNFSLTKDKPELLETTLDVTI